MDDYATCSIIVLMESPGLCNVYTIEKKIIVQSSGLNPDLDVDNP